jgi:small neutral amino acid transporter SnatA (MarC family)
MKTVSQHIEHIKGKPHHVRKRVAFTVAGSATVLIALVWLVGSVSLGAFAITGSSFADSAGQSSVVTTGSADTSTPGLAGAAAASASDNSPAHIEIVDTTPSTPQEKKAEQTLIPF